MQTSDEKLQCLKRIAQNGKLIVQIVTTVLSEKVFKDV